MFVIIKFIFTIVILSSPDIFISADNSEQLSNLNQDGIEDDAYINDHHDAIEESKFYWNEKNLETLYHHLMTVPNTNIARNIIFFIGDGMSLSTITSARILEGQRNGGSGENNRLSWDRFPYTGLSKTYCVDKLVPDSACTGTAYWTGVKNNYGTLGVTAQVKQRDCNAVNASTSVKTLLHYGQEAGKSTGIVTTTRVTHASPAAGYAHSAHRDYEADSDIVADRQNPFKCTDIATQLVSHSPGKNINVILGGGTTNFLPAFKFDKYGHVGMRLDGKDLIEEWQFDKQARFGGHEEIVWDVEGLKNVNYHNTSFLLGLFSPSHMSYNLEADRSKEPTLAEMTDAAIKVLSKNPNGFVLFVEGGKIDLGHHATQPKKALDETVELNKAVEVAMSLTNPMDTLIVVTSDHSHTMSISGYPARGTNILKFGGKSDMDGMPYTILSYANGPKAGRHYMDNNELDQSNLAYPSLVPMKDETHSGEDVAVYAYGPWAHILSGVYEQTYIPSAMKFASCIGPSITACNYYNIQQSKAVQQQRNKK